MEQEASDIEQQNYPDDYIEDVTGDHRQGLATNLNEFWDVCADKGIELPQTKSISASSFCEARQKLPEDIFKDLNKTLLKNWNENRCLPTWLEHRVYAVDGSTSQEN